MVFQANEMSNRILDVSYDYVEKTKWMNENEKQTALSKVKLFIRTNVKYH